MRILLVKRLENSFFAFRNTVERFIVSYRHFLTELDKGNVYVSKSRKCKIFELLENATMDLPQMQKGLPFLVSPFYQLLLFCGACFNGGHILATFAS